MPEALAFFFFWQRNTYKSQDTLLYFINTHSHPPAPPGGSSGCAAACCFCQNHGQCIVDQSTNTFILDSGEVYLTKDETIVNWKASTKIPGNRSAKTSTGRSRSVILLMSADSFSIFGGGAEQREDQWLARISSGSGGALGSAPTKLLRYDIILAAIANNPRALEYASPELKNCKDVVLAAANSLCM